MKILHISFHKGCINDLNYVFDNLNIQYETMFFFNEDTSKSKNIHNDYYVITEKKANNLWIKYKEYFNTFDIIITSDTAPLSRIFLQNNWNKPLIIWICNRFDYGIENDISYYKLIRKSRKLLNVKLIGYTAFENLYCNRIRNVNIGNNVITPCGGISNIYDISINKPELNDTFFVPKYHNDTIMMDISKHLNNIGIKSVGKVKYNGPNDLLNYKGIIHIPYAWSNLAFFEGLQLGIVYFIPSINFLYEIIKDKSFFWSPPFYKNLIIYSEWYNSTFDKYIIKFESWDDLKTKINNLDFIKHRNYIKEFGQVYKFNVINKWKNIFDTYKSSHNDEKIKQKSVNFKFKKSRFSMF